MLYLSNSSVALEADLIDAVRQGLKPEPGKISGDAAPAKNRRQP
jgi:hypothetical protein